jgi:hypothetical protein
MVRRRAQRVVSNHEPPSSFQTWRAAPQDEAETGCGAEDTAVYFGASMPGMVIWGISICGISIFTLSGSIFVPVPL